MSGTDGGAQARLRADAGEPMYVTELGTVDYHEAWELQQQLVERRREGLAPDTVVLLEHPPVYTLGRRASAANVLLDEGQLADAGIDLVSVDRGGDVTYHGPGQLVVYPVLRLAGQRHVVDFVRALEQVAILALKHLGVHGTRREGLTGVWVEHEKIVAIGVRVGAGGITSHGLALNVAPDLAHFRGIIPCGLATEGVTSLAALGLDTDMRSARDAVREALAETFRTTLIDGHTVGVTVPNGRRTEESDR